MLRRMRWMTDGDGRWELDVEAPATMEGTARPVPGDPLPLGLSRGPRVTRTKQLDFLHRFMASPLVPSFSASRAGLSLHHAHLLHLADNWREQPADVFVANFTSCVREEVSDRNSCPLLLAPRRLRVAGCDLAACQLYQLHAAESRHRRTEPRAAWPRRKASPRTSPSRTLL